MIHIALPVLDDTVGFLQVLDDLLDMPEPYCLWVCVNHPESWRFDPDRQYAILENTRLLAFLARCQQPIRILDYASLGSGWPAGKAGIGWARKVLFDAIMSEADPYDWIVSLDADTRLSPNYLSALYALSRTAWLATVIPYWHLSVSDQKITLAGSFYELYLRLYRLQLIAAGAQFQFTPLGSAMAVRVDVCRRIGGLTPKPAGEDFYFLQKVAKHTAVKPFLDTLVYPAMRFSDRVIFGTGPAISDIVAGRGFYPLYPNTLWQEVADTIAAFPVLFLRDIETPMSTWLQKQLGVTDLWGTMRRTFKTQARFVHACHERVDGLRIFQYLRQAYVAPDFPLSLCDVLPSVFWSYPEILKISPFMKIPVQGLSLQSLHRLRLALFSLELSCYHNLPRMRL